MSISKILRESATVYRIITMIVQQLKSCGMMKQTDQRLLLQLIYAIMIYANMNYANMVYANMIYGNMIYANMI